MLRFKFHFILIIFSLSFGCQKNPGQENASKTVQVEEADVSENQAYLKLGKLKLSEYGFFLGSLSSLTPAERVIPYELNSPLFSDYALKKRFIYLPEGEHIQVNEDKALEFPVGSVLIKNFYFEDEQLLNQPSRIIETRLLIREEMGWKALPYIWNKEQTEAYLEIAGGSTGIHLTGWQNPIAYSVPTMPECKSCHEKNGAIEPIGPSIRQLNRNEIIDDEEINQLAYMQKIDWLKEGSSPESMERMADYHDPSSSIEDRARAYLDVNCAHCHRLEGPAKNSGLNLRYNNTDPYSLGINKPPVAAGKGSGGLQFDIVKGKPDESILIYRMNSNDPGIMMPELGRHIVHEEGLELLRRWVLEMGD